LNDDYSGFDGEIGETIEVMVVHDEDESELNSKSNLHVQRMLSYEEICEILSEEEKLRRESVIHFNYKGRLIRDIVLIVLIVIVYIFTNPFTNIESSDPIWKMVLSMLSFSACLFGFYLSIRVLKKDWRFLGLYKDKEWFDVYKSKKNNDSH
jgi:hypothetical protein